MTSTVARETILPSSELDSEGSSAGEEREVAKRLREDADSSSPKKRRKQTTPVRVPTSLIRTDERPESEEELEDETAQKEEAVESNGKLAPENQSVSIKDENLNTEFKCQYCGRAFGDNENLSHHLDSEHGVNPPPVPSPSGVAQLQGSVRVKIESQQGQSEEPENPVNLSGLSIKNFASSWMAGPTQLQPPEPAEWSGQNSVAGHLTGLPFPGALAQYLPLPGFPLGDPGQLPRVAMGPAPIRIFNPDAYCDLCNKEFCNKYFLKTHKANKHGIYVDTPQQNSDNNGTHFSNLPFSLGNNKIDQPIQQSASKIELPPVPLVVVCEICQKRFKNEDSLRKHKQKSHLEVPQSESDSQSLPAIRDSTVGADERDVLRCSPSAMESLFKQEFGIEQEDAKFMPAPRHLSPQSIQQARESGFNADRLRKLGVLNVEAFCEICCKEYCNKYFLRTHKMKTHGILVQDSEKSPSTPGAAASWHQIQTSPLNLIVAESIPGSSESNDKSDEYECKSCGIKFQTLGLYRAHNVKMHEISDDEKSPKQETEEERTDSISEDLQKLQTMILQLNGIESSKTFTCEICGRECENKLALKAHMTFEHARNLTDEAPSPGQLIDNTSNNTSVNLLFCTLCERDFQSHDALRQHIAEEHSQQASPMMVQSSAPSNTPQISSALPPGAQLTASIPPTASSTPSTTPVPPIPPPPDKKISSLTPTSSYCEICNKELCNKYFMKTHMQRMHGIEIENGSQIGGVICNICNKELCSKYFLRVHKQNTHGIVDEGTTGSSNKQDNFEPPPGIDDSALKPDQLGDLSHRYYTHFTEVCPICNRRFRSIKWLKAHLLSDHGRNGIEKWRELEQQYQNVSRSRPGSVGSSSRSSQQNPNIKIPNGLDIGQIKGDYGGLGNQVMSTLFGNTEEQQAKNYRCSYCSFTTPVLPFLFLHERSHTGNQEPISSEAGLQCPICSQSFPQPELLHHHLVVRHQFSNLLSQYQPSSVSELRSEASQERSDLDSKDADVKDEKSDKTPPAAEAPKSQHEEHPGVVLVTPQGAYKCAECGYATANLNRIKKHTKNHKAKGDPTESVITELSKTLRDVANKHKLPASYAMPQDMNSNPDSTVMQPFIIEEHNGTFGDESSGDRRFAPVLVYLPVRTRINSVLTASFTLSPT